MKPTHDDEEIQRIVQQTPLRIALSARGRKEDALSDGSAEASGSRRLHHQHRPKQPRHSAAPCPEGEPYPLAPAGFKLRELRLRSGWTTEEIADRTGLSAGLLAAFEAGDSVAAGELTCSDLEWLAGACCGTLADLLGQDHPWVRAARRQESRRLDGLRSLDPLGVGSGCFIDPTG